MTGPLSEYPCLRTCVYRMLKLDKLKRLYLKNYTLLIELKFGVEVRPKCLFLEYNLRQNKMN